MDAAGLDGTITGRLSESPALQGVLSSEGTISGELNACVSLVGELTQTPALSGALVPETGMTGRLTVPPVIYADELPVYDGSYEVTPLPGAEVILPTARMIMEGDVIVAEIPYYETSNASGGYTAIIG